MKGRTAAPRPMTRQEIRAQFTGSTALTREALEQFINASTSFPFIYDVTPEPTPFERGVLNRYQDRRRKS